MPEAISYPQFLTEINNHFGQKGLSILIIELKELNDLDSALGYPAIDKITEQLVQVTLDSLREQDKIALLGRHQIGVLLPGMPSKNHALLAGHKLLRLLTKPVQYQEDQLIIRPIIGIATADEKTPNADILLSQANSAMKTAIAQFRNLALYDDSSYSSLLAEHNLLSDLAKAIEESDLFLALQPQFSLTSSKTHLPHQIK